jgi:hypothetical protein
VRSPKPNTSKLSRQQKELLYWIGKELRVYRRYANAISDFESFKEALPSGIARLSAGWHPERFLKRPPDRNESAAIARNLKRLEERGLVYRRYYRGNEKKTSHVSLTKAGALFWYSLEMDRQKPPNPETVNSTDETR